MKRIYLLILTVMLALPGMAQIQYIPASIHWFSVSAGGGVTMLYGDLSKKVLMPAGKINFDYNFTPYISAGIEGQVGKLAEGDPDPQSEQFGLYSENSYFAFNANARLAIGQFLPTPENGFAELLGGIYAGAGIGYISSENKQLVRSYSYTSNFLQGNFYTESEGIVYPLNFGVNYDLPVYRLGINLNFQYTFTGSEELDGYDIAVLNNNDNDAYSLISLSVRYFFGPTH